MIKKPSVIIVSAPSGCGKTTLVSRVLKTLPNVTRSVSATSRPPRKGEREKIDYYFVSEKVFKRKVEKGEFLEWAKNFGYYYGTPKKSILEKLKSGKDVILTIDVKGASQIKKKMPNCLMIFVMPPNFLELANRLKKRGLDKVKDMDRRLKIAKKEILFSKRYDYIVVNDNLRKTVDELKSIITTKRCESGKYWN